MATLEKPAFKVVEPRDTIEIHLPDARAICGLRGEPVGKFLECVQSPVLTQLAALDSNVSQPPPIVGAVINGDLRELTYPMQMDATVIPVTMADADGMRIYRRSLTFLLEAAFEDLFPEASLTIDHSVASGGYYCEVTGRTSLGLEDLTQLEAHMRDLVEKDLPFVRSEIPLAEAIQTFKARGEEDKVRLLSFRQKNYLTVYTLGDFTDYYHGYMVPSTGFLRWFGLILTGQGFTLRFPRRHAPTMLLPMPEYPTLLKTFLEYSSWLEKLGISNVAALNSAIHSTRSHEIVLVSEALHEQRISDIADLIAGQSERVRIVLIAGPSSSGKTTFSKRLSVQLLVRGISPFPLELDNYFVARDENSQG